MSASVPTIPVGVPFECEGKRWRAVEATSYQVTYQVMPRYPLDRFCYRLEMPTEKFVQWAGLLPITRKRTPGDGLGPLLRGDLISVPYIVKGRPAGKNPQRDPAIPDHTYQHDDIVLGRFDMRWEHGSGPSRSAGLHNNGTRPFLLNVMHGSDTATISIDQITELGFEIDWTLLGDPIQWAYGESAGWAYVGEGEAGIRSQAPAPPRKIDEGAPTNWEEAESAALEQLRARQNRKPRDRGDLIRALDALSPDVEQWEIDAFLRDRKYETYVRDKWQLVLAYRRQQPPEWGQFCVFTVEVGPEDARETWTVHHNPTGVMGYCHFDFYGPKPGHVSETGYRSECCTNRGDYPTPLEYAQAFANERYRETSRKKKSKKVKSPELPAIPEPPTEPHHGRPYQELWNGASALPRDPLGGYDLAGNEAMASLTHAIKLAGYYPRISTSGHIDAKKAARACNAILGLPASDRPAPTPERWREAARLVKQLSDDGFAVIEALEQLPEDAGS